MRVFVTPLRNIPRSNVSSTIQNMYPKVAGTIECENKKNDDEHPSSTKVLETKDKSSLKKKNGMKQKSIETGIIKRKKSENKIDVKSKTIKKTKKSNLINTNIGGAKKCVINSELTENKTSKNKKLRNEQISESENKMQPIADVTNNDIQFDFDRYTVLAKDPDSNVNNIICSQNSRKDNLSQNFIKMILSQPPKKISHKQRMLWLQERRQVGIWVQCGRVQCNKWRYLADVYDPLDVPDKWFCEMNLDKEANNCALVEDIFNPLVEEDLIHAEYTAGSLVWARLEGHPWWPGLVDDCPDTEQFYWLNGFSDIPTYYNITFFDKESVTRAWITVDQLKPYAKFGKKCNFKPDKVPKDLQTRMAVAIKQANEAIHLGILERLKKYSFVSRYEGPINFPIKVKFTKNTKVNCNSSDSDFSDSSSSDDENMFESQQMDVSESKLKELLKPSKIVSSQKNKKPKIVPETESQILGSNELTSKESSNLLTEDIPIQGSIHVRNSQIVYQTVDTCSGRSKSEWLSKSSFQNLQEVIEVDDSDNEMNALQETMNNDTIEQTIEETDNLSTSDAVVPSTQTNLKKLDFENSPSMLDKSLDFEMF